MAERTFRREMIFQDIVTTLGKYDFLDFRDDIPGLVKGNIVSDANILVMDIVLIVQSCPGNKTSGNSDRS